MKIKLPLVPSCSMSATELEQASRAHFHFTEKLLQDVKVRRASERQQPLQIQPRMN